VADRSFLAALFDRAVQLVGWGAKPPATANDGRPLALGPGEGGQIAPLPTSQTRWFLSDLEAAIHDADLGDLARAARLCRSMRRDGKLAGVLSTRTEGLVRLPIRWSGREDMARELEGRDRRRGVFARMCPTPELALLAGDGILLGVGVAEMLPVPNDDAEDAPREYVLRRLEPEWLRYRWAEDAWYYNSVAGPIRIIPGAKRPDGGWWVLHRPGGISTPWNSGLWPSLGASYIAKQHAILHRENYSAKLAQAARAAISPAAATEAQRLGFLSKLIAWGVNQVFDLPPGWDVKLIESNGRGYEVFQDTIDTSDGEYVVAVAGQTVTTDGGAGFANAEIHKTIRADLIQSTGDGLAITINEQILPPYVNERWGAGALREGPELEWDTRPPKEQKAAADALMSTGLAIRNCNEALRPYNRRVDIYEIATRFDLPLAGIEQPATQPRESEPNGNGETDATDQDPGAEVVDPGPGTGNGEKGAQFATRIHAVADNGARVRDYAGIKVVIDRPRGFLQRGTDEHGQPWSRVYRVDYGYIDGTLGGDGEELDAFCGPNRHAPWAFVAVQHDDAGDFDEYKLLLGFDSEVEARACYTDHIPSKFLGRVFPMPVEMLRGLLGLEPRARRVAIRAAQRRAERRVA
jgi:hypothetical protein